MTEKQLEKYSSAFTLSDMEIFIFPELLYSLVLANIMSPEIWKWRDDKWFRKIEKKSPLKRVQRVKQYIMDHYHFNLDLETWGLTDKETEINRFRNFIDIEILKQSNALFGYEGDKYYFDIDIRRHFGLDKFDTEIIPYWKTETVEAMNAFRFKKNHTVGAGECVSLATLYAAALFVVARIPLEQIFLMGTPLHSQNYVMVDEGVLTNNRRIVTKTMWYNGTELSTLARRALEHEHVTIVAHHTGYIHTVYPEATIDKEVYHTFKKSLTAFLNTHVNYEIFINFLRVNRSYQKLFQIEFPCCGGLRYIQLEDALCYEHGSKHRLGDNSATKLLSDMDESEMNQFPIDSRIVIRPTDSMFRKRPCSIFTEDLRETFPQLKSVPDFLTDLKHFVHTIPKLPSGDKIFTSNGMNCGITVEHTREEIIDLLSSIQHPASSIEHRASSTEHRAPSTEHRASSIEHRASSIQLAFYAGRFMDLCDWEPFLKAVMERNPVSIAYFRDTDPNTVYQELQTWPDESIYEGNRLALPDEVVNFQRADGIEKALTLANILRARDRGTEISLKIDHQKVQLKASKERFDFKSKKKFTKNLTL